METRPCYIGKKTFLGPSFVPKIYFMKKKIAIHWFRFDLRVSDNPSLNYLSRNYDNIVGIYIFDEINSDPNIGSEKHFQNMIDQSILAEKLGYKTVSIPEHHLINILMMPSPLQWLSK